MNETAPTFQVRAYIYSTYIPTHARFFVHASPDYIPTPPPLAIRSTFAENARAGSLVKTSSRLLLAGWLAACCGLFRMRERERERESLCE